METSPFICSLNQWTGFFVIGTSVMKELSLLLAIRFYIFLTFKIYYLLIIIFINLFIYSPLMTEVHIHIETSPLIWNLLIQIVTWSNWNSLTLWLLPYWSAYELETYTLMKIMNVYPLLRNVARFLKCIWPFYDTAK